jgi:methanogenic corrinoid protein MtbC1
MDVAQCHPHLQLIDRLEKSLLAMDRLEPQRCYRDSGLDPLRFAESVLCPALDRIGTAWQAGEVALSQVYMSGRFSEELLETILPAGGAPTLPHPPIAIAVLDDSHPLGKRIVGSYLRANGFHLTDYGSIGVAPLLARLQADGIRILLISTLMLPSALRVREVRAGVDAAGLPVRLVVGGAPFRMDPGLWREVGADATSASRPAAAAAAAGGDMTAMERVLAALSHREADRVPFFLMFTMHGARELGLGIREYFSRPEYVAEGQLRLRARFGHDCLYGFSYASAEIEAWGGETLFSEEGPPNAAGPCLRDIEAIPRLTYPRVADSPSLGRVLATQRLLRERSRGEVPIIGTVMSPFSLPVMQLGFERYLEVRSSGCYPLTAGAQP